MTDTAGQNQPAKSLEPIYRRNFALFLADGVLFTVALGMLGTTTVIPDFVRTLTDSEILIGISSSLFEFGWLLPQLLVARYLVRAARKKWWFAGPNIVVRLSIPVLAGIIFLLGAERPSAILVGFLIAYGIAAVGDGMVGVPWVDLAGSSLNDRWRARMFGMMTGIGGLIMLGVTPVVGVILGENGPPWPNNYALVFALSGGLFVISILPPLFIHELPGGKPVETVPPFSEYIPSLGRVLREDSSFRAMIITRVLTSLYNMAGPFYIGFATVQLKMSSSVAVPNLLAMQTAGMICGAVVYSWMGVRHNLRYIRLSMVLGALLPISALIASVTGPLPLYVGFFTAGLALSNLFAAYLNWVIQHATPEQRPIYTGLFNTIAAVTLLAVPLIGGTIVETVGYEAVFVVALVMILAAFYVVMRHIPDPRAAKAEVEAQSVAAD